MKLRQNYHEDDKPVIVPAKGKNDPHLGPDALMLMIPSEVNHLVSITNAKPHPISDISIQRIFLVENLDKGPLAISGPFLGAPQAVLAMEKLIVLGVERLWVMGWCGSISPKLRIGDMFVPTSAYSEEGTSKHYPVDTSLPQPNQELTKRVCDVIGQRGFSLVHGPIWTTDAPYRETRKKITSFQSRGVLAVDMEMSALMTVAKYRSIKLAGLLVVSDELFNLVWKTGFGTRQLKEHSREAAEILLQLATTYE